ncbi:hypothetical protein [Vibrio sp. MEBiC08052]|nr:hypothetical protein [Vibrio sp. MEBiC08052]KUJ00313.1 hypothetical protein VRK_04440 [Vibrio sp. MEBiC08052]
MFEDEFWYALSIVITIIKIRHSDLTGMIELGKLGFSGDGS